MNRLLVVEDDPEIGRQLTEVLTAQGYRPTWARSARAALAELARGARPDLVLLDLGLPDLDGVAVCRELRAARPDMVIVVLTARTEEIDAVVALDAGADDYVGKPFRLGELLARVRAHLRRAGGRGGDVTVGPLRIDPASRRCTVGGVEVALRPKEFDLLLVLAGAAGRAVSRDRLIRDVWDEHWHGSTKTLDMHVLALRRKLAAAGLPGEAITTLRGYGYRYETASVPAP